MIATASNPNIADGTTDTVVGHADCGSERSEEDKQSVGVGPGQIEKHCTSPRGVDEDPCKE